MKHLIILALCIFDVFLMSPRGLGCEFAPFGAVILIILIALVLADPPRGFED